MDIKKRILALLLAALLLLGGAVLAEGENAQDAQTTGTDETADTEEAVDTEETASENAGLLATVNGVQVSVEDAYNEYQYYAMLYSYYGYGAEDIAALKEEVADYYVELELIRQQYEKLGLNESLDMDALKADAAEEYEAAAEEYLIYVTDETLSEADALAAAKAMLDEDGYDLAYFERLFYDQECITAIMEYYEEEVSVSEEDIRAYYDDLVAQDKQLVEEDPGYYEVMTGYGERVMYVPEGLRAVKHILVLLSEEDQSRMYDLEAELEEIEISLEAEDADTQTLNARKAEIEQEMDEIYAVIEPTIDEIMDRLTGGEDFIALMEEYGEDPGMTYEPYMTDGYFVHAESEQWVIPFRDAAMALEKAGDISSPVRTSYGLHIIRYEYDVPAGPVAYEEVYEDMKAEVSTEAFDQYFTTLLEQWRTASEIEVYLENLDAPAEEE